MFDQDLVAKATERAKKEYSKIQKSLQSVAGRLLRLGKKRGELESLRTDSEICLDLLREAAIVDRALDPKLIELRERIITALATLQAGDIQVKEVPALKARVEKWKLELRKMCPHTLVGEKRGYEDYSENVWRNGHRLCVICGLIESGVDPSILRTINCSDTYGGKLADAESRLVEHLSFEEPTIWKPLEKLVPKFVDRARIEKLVKKLTS